MKNFFLFAITTLISLLLIELILREFGYNPRKLEPNSFFVDNVQSTWSLPDIDVGWINKPGISVSIEEGEALMSFLSHGRRRSSGKDDLENKKLNIMLVGGSNAQSYGVADKDTFAYLINQNTNNVKIDNFGTGGYGTVQSLILAKRNLKQFYKKIKPDLVILTFADSHFLRNVSDFSWMKNISDKNGFYVSPPHYRFVNNNFIFQPFNTIEPWFLETYSSILTSLHFIWIKYVTYDSKKESMKVTDFSITLLQKLAQQYGSKFLVLILEDYSGKSEQFFQEKKFNYLNCSGYERTDPKSYLLGGGSHPNNKFHKHFSDCLGEWITQNYVKLIGK